MNDNRGIIDFTDPTTWNKIILKAENQNPFEQPLSCFTPTVTARKKNKRTGFQSIQIAKPESLKEKPELWQNISCETDMFMVMSKRLFEVLIVLWENVNDDYFLSRYLLIIS